MFGAMGQMIAYSGYDTAFADANASGNIPWIMAHGLSAYTGRYYPVFVPLLGWVGTFLTGYGVASLMLFGKLQVETAALLGVDAPWLASALAVGASIGSISSPVQDRHCHPYVRGLGKRRRNPAYDDPHGSGDLPAGRCRSVGGPQVLV